MSNSHVNQPLINTHPLPGRLPVCGLLIHQLNQPIKFLQISTEIWFCLKDDGHDEDILFKFFYI